MPDRLGVLAPERADHTSMITLSVINGKRHQSQEALAALPTVVFRDVATSQLLVSCRSLPPLSRCCASTAPSRRPSGCAQATTGRRRGWCSPPSSADQLTPRKFRRPFTVGSDTWSRPRRQVSLSACPRIGGAVMDDHFSNGIDRRRLKYVPIRQAAWIIGARRPRQALCC